MPAPYEHNDWMVRGGAATTRGTGGLLDMLALPRRRLDVMFRDGDAVPPPTGRYDGVFLYFSGTALAPVAARALSLAWRGKAVEASRGGLIHVVSALGAHAVRAPVGPRLS